MAEEKQKEPWLNYLALATVIFAISATLSTFKGGGFSTKSVISQAQASDQWAFYQAKAIKGDLYQAERDTLAVTLAALPANATAQQRKVYADKLAEYDKKIAKYTAEKAQIMQTARALEATRDAAQRQGKPFGIAVIFLQVAILISSIAGLFHQRKIWYLALPVGLVGLLYFADGFFLFL
ncbi:MAG: DUF4337 domain-containing protein [Paludibacterium sp.]|uniref:DUF4337 domain-containing protein n=1 Tax=Paludibacterium sp. TaxID=1917523 RepID=UPI0025ED9E72|nr:DUF4337 domain-containing protein [Paludibacterium sp.]MBV8045525.1 DUF4337 domain-containing protein [Paludibacterium sp.]MBV8647982.1 DUF4337 domain-containing protein [Paludibacterium sp.]